MQRTPDDFDDLRKLLVVKRYEAPPPGYFHRFPDRIIARIEAQNAAMAPQIPWWRQWLGELAQRPVLAAVYGALVGGLAIVAMGLSQSPLADHPVQPMAAWGAPAALNDLRPVSISAEPVARAAIRQSSVSPVVVTSLDQSPFAFHGLNVERVAFRQR